MLRLKTIFTYSCIFGSIVYIILSRQWKSSKCESIVLTDSLAQTRRTHGCDNRYIDTTENEIRKLSSMNTTTNIQCQSTAHQNIVYIKVHKAASSTMHQILLRHGLYTNKILALPKWWHYFDFSKPFHRTMALGYEQRGKSELLINHARYNRPEMDAVVEGAVYLASLREPASQFESTFGFFKLARHFEESNDLNMTPLEILMSNPDCYSSRFPFHGSLRNQQFFDLGLDPEYFDDICAVERKIEELDKSLDLVLISEYLDESLVLMKYLLCLDFSDILYIPANVRSNKYRNKMSESVSSKIKLWNSADMFLYNHFNRTLWRLINQYGEQFSKDLQTFRELRQKTTDECVNYTDSNVDQRLWKIRIKKDASQFCRNVSRSSNPIVKSIRSEVIAKYGTMLDKIVDKTITWVEKLIARWKSK